MLDVVRDVIKSKTMMGVLIFMILVSYISAMQNKSLSDSKIDLYVTSNIK